MFREHSYLFLVEDPFVSVYYLKLGQTSLSSLFIKLIDFCLEVVYSIGNTCTLRFIKCPVGLS